MLLEKVAKDLYKMTETCRKFSKTATYLIWMLFKTKNEKWIFGIMNFQKKSRNGNEKRIFKLI